ncbi:MAG: ornithine cyclodeaminase family protein [Candidatus Bathyarchaeia archaeon]
MLILSDNDIAEVLEMEETIDVVEEAFSEYARGGVVMPPRSTIMIDKHEGSISFMPSYIERSEAEAAKIISIYPKNPERGFPTTMAWIVVNDPKTGELLAFMDATYITAMRTGAITGVAAKYLAPRDSEIAGVYGAGVQGRTQAWAASTVLDLDQIKVYDIDREARQKFASEMTEKLGIEVKSVDNARYASEDADIIMTATTSSKPVFKRDWLGEKVHVSAIGAFYPDYRELDTATVVESKLVVDDLEGVIREAGDVLIPIKEGAMTEDDIYAELKELVSGTKEGRTEEDGLTVFKSVGIAIQDSSVANLVLDQIGVR